MKSTSWHHVGKWYNKHIDLKGNYYHEHIVIPNTLKLLSLTPKSSILDLACGQGILERFTPQSVYYEGFDIAPSLISYAQKNIKFRSHKFFLSDVTKALPTGKLDFTHATLILSLQNIENPLNVLSNAYKHLLINGKLVIVLNHPCFRIPRQSSWEIDERNKIEYRRINRYLTPFKIPINMHPGQQDLQVTWSFHNPISFYSDLLFSNGFVIQKIEEWSSDKKSTGAMKRMENRSRSEFPLFMAFSAVKIR